MEGRRFCDNIALGGYFIDIHSSTDTHGKWVRIEKGYGIPYRTMIPENISGMIVAGRSISGTREASASYRVMATCMAIGQAAGVAAALCCRDNMDPGDINFCELQDILKSQDAII